MNPKLLVGMNLTPERVPALRNHGWEAAHWSDDGDPRASDEETMDWAVTHQFVVFTHDVAFGTMLVLPHEAGPSVIQIRTHEPMPDHLEGAVLSDLDQHESDLSASALVLVDKSEAGFECCLYTATPPPGINAS